MSSTHPARTSTRTRGQAGCERPCRVSVLAPSYASEAVSHGVWTQKPTGMARRLTDKAYPSFTFQTSADRRWGSHHRSACLLPETTARIHENKKRRPARSASSIGVLLSAGSTRCCGDAKRRLPRPPRRPEQRCRQRQRTWCRPCRAGSSCRPCRPCRPCRRRHRRRRRARCRCC